MSLGVRACRQTDKRVGGQVVESLWRRGQGRRKREIEQPGGEARSRRAKRTEPANEACACVGSVRGARARTREYLGGGIHPHRGRVGPGTGHRTGGCPQNGGDPAGPPCPRPPGVPRLNRRHRPGPRHAGAGGRRDRRERLRLTQEVRWPGTQARLGYPDADIAPGAPWGLRAWPPVNAGSAGL